MMGFIALGSIMNTTFREWVTVRKFDSGNCPLALRRLPEAHFCTHCRMLFGSSEAACRQLQRRYLLQAISAAVAGIETVKRIDRPNQNIKRIE